MIYHGRIQQTAQHNMKRKINKEDFISQQTQALFYNDGEQKDNNTQTLGLLLVYRVCQVYYSFYI